MYSMAADGGNVNTMLRRVDAVMTEDAKPDPKIRKDFPESWIYETLEDAGSVRVFLESFLSFLCFVTLFHVLKFDCTNVFYYTS